MLALWMGYAVTVASLLGVAGAFLERVLRERALPGRWVWIGALVVSAALPPLAPTLSRSSGEAPPPSLQPVPLPGLDVALVLEERAAPLLERTDGPLLALWAAASALLLVLGVGSWARLGLARRAWREARIDGEAVLVSNGLGPAVVGLFTPQIVVPGWVEQQGRETRSLILAHEREHLRARDPLLVLAGTLLAVLFPWNPALWWQLGRLRLGVEVDCDRRVLGAGATAAARRRYGRLLLEAGERRGGRAAGALAVAAFAERRSLLERRIREITRARTRPALRRAVTSLGAALLLLVVACIVPAPDETPTGPEDARRSAVETSAAAPGTVHLEAGPVVTPFSVAPRLTNADEVRELLDRAYPEELRALGVGGTVGVWFLVDEAGALLQVRIDRSSGNAQLDRAALGVARGMRFAPALDGDRPVPAWVSLPITFRPEEAAPRIREPVPSADPAAAIAELRDRAGAGDAAPEAVVPGIDGSGGPRFTPFTARPELLNMSEVQRTLVEAYPPLLRDAGVGGSPVVWLHIDASGELRQALLHTTSGHAPLDEAALDVARRMRWAPARNGDEPVEVWISLPITFGPP